MSTFSWAVFATLLFISPSISAQNTAADPTLDAKNWMHSDFSTTKIHGVGTDAAILFLKSKNVKPTTITVAVLDSGVEPDHEDLKANMWVNPAEIKGNNIDDDKNGYIDDVNGWNFIGGKNGNVNYDTYEMLRIVKQYRPMFEGENAAKNKRKMKKEFALYEKAKAEYTTKKEEAKSGLQMVQMQKDMILEQFTALKGLIGTKKLTQENVDAIVPKDEKETSMKQGLQQLIKSNIPDLDNKNIDDIIVLINQQLKEGEDHYKVEVDYQLNEDYDARSVVGDDYSNKTEKYYGNNDVEGPDAMHGTHVAGIIAAVRNNGKGMNGIAGDVAKIMSVRVVPNGDERDKDIANAIRYAVDNGARVINMSFGKGYSPEANLVWKAMKYAQKKNVLLVHGAGNDNVNVDTENRYPSKFKDGADKPFIKNCITVGANTDDNTELKADFSNYGVKKVDLFAPGTAIYSTVIDNKYKNLDGTSMASPAVAGCAAFLWAYFPHLKVVQVKEILMASVDKVSSKVTIGKNDKGEMVTSTFTDLSVAGGTIDLLSAVKLAYEKYSK